MAYRGLGDPLDDAVENAAERFVNAAVPKVQAKIPGMIDDAWPRIEDRLPDMVASLKPYIAQMSHDAVQEGFKDATLQAMITATRNEAMVGLLVVVVATSALTYALVKYG